MTTKLPISTRATNPWPSYSVFPAPVNAMKEGLSQVTRAETLTFALEGLHASDPDTFPSTDRYAYRITNSWPEPLAMSLGTASQPKDSQVHETGNVRRVVDELRGCGVLELCGRKAQLLSDCIRSPERTVVHMCDTGNQSLNGTYRLGIASMARSPVERRRARRTLGQGTPSSIAIAQVDGTPS
jgi:hypothetical protein